jgi:hypothetical protein
MGQLNKTILLKLSYSANDVIFSISEVLAQSRQSVKVNSHLLLTDTSKVGIHSNQIIGDNNKYSVCLNQD